MKTIRGLSLVTGILAMLLCTVPTGCALFQRGSTAEYNTLWAAGYTVDNAISAYDGGLAAGIIPTNNAPTVQKYYNDFQTGYRLALKAAEGGSNSIAPANLTLLEQKLLAATGGAK